jgi:hypothetical protein
MPRRALSGLLAAFLCLSGGLALAASDPAPPAATCSVPAAADWSTGEQWAWSEVCAGRAADFARRYGGGADPAAAASWPPERTIGAGFLAALLQRPPWRDAVTPKGVRLIGVRLAEPLDLTNAAIAVEFRLEASRIEAPFVLAGAHGASRMSFDGTRFAAAFDLGRLDLAGGLTLRHAMVVDLWLSGARIGDDADLADLVATGAVALNDARIAGTLTLSRQRAGGSVDLHGTTVERDLAMDHAELAAARLDDARVGGYLRLTSSHVAGSLSMERIKVGSDLVMDTKGQFADVRLVAADIGGDLSMGASHFTGPLNLEDSRVGSDVNMNNGADFASASLANARVGGYLRLYKARVAGLLNLDRVKVGVDLLMNKQSSFAAIGLFGAEIGGNLVLDQASVGGTLSANDLRVKGDLLMRDGAEFGRVDLPGAEIGGDLTTSGALFQGSVDMTGIKVGRNLSLGQRTRFARPVLLAFARIGTNLDLTDGEFGSLDLTGATIGAEIRLASRERPTDRMRVPNWQPQSRLSLRNVTASALQDLPEAWPQELDLEGFTYARLGGYRGGDGSDLVKRKAGDFVEWLAKDPDYSPLPYTQLAGVLKQAGDLEKAKRILYAGRARQWREAHGLTRFWLSLHWAFTGFGYYPEVSGLWAILLVLVGAALFGHDRTSEIRLYSRAERLIYSLDMLLPIVQLRHHHYQFDLVGWPKFYLYFHKMMGYVLISFLVAALAGATG